MIELNIINTHYMYLEFSMPTKRVTTRRKVVEPTASATKSYPTAALGLCMIILTNYQAEVKQILSLIVKALT
jgi:hypothetical protein